MIIALLNQGLFHKARKLNIQTGNTASETGLLAQMSQITSSLNEERITSHYFRQGSWAIW